MAFVDGYAYIGFDIKELKRVNMVLNQMTK